MKPADAIARAHQMTDERWRRHANPWSVWTRFAAIPAFVLAVWSRVWIGWWAFLPVAAVIAWLFFNTVVFRPISEPVAWTSRGILGEQIWLEQHDRVPPGYRTVLRWLIGVGLIGFVLLIWGLMRLDAWPTVFGAALIVVGQLWRIDRMGTLYDQLSVHGE